MKLAGKSSTPQEGSDPLIGTLAQTDVVLHMMLRDKIPMTRDNYLALAYPTGVPNPWTAELEAELPPMFQSKAGSRRSST